MAATENVTAMAEQKNETRKTKSDLSAFVFLLSFFCSAVAFPDTSLFSGTTSQALVDPELTHSVATPPAQVPEPPPQLHLPELISDSKQWRGPQCGVTEPRFAVFRHADKWEAFWKKGMAPYLPRRLSEPPKVDFDKDMVVGVFLGEQRDPHYGIEIRSIRPTRAPAAPALRIQYRDIHTMSGVFNPPFPVQPYHLRRVPRFDGEVQFEALKR